METTTIIPLTRNRVAVIDADDYERVACYRWHCTNRGYAMRNDFSTGRRVMMPMHRLILDAPKGVQVDHINGDKLDNRKCNLRLATASENLRNQRRRKPKKYTSYKGVCWVKCGKTKVDGTPCTLSQPWRAYIELDGRQKSLGCYFTPEEAARAYDAAAREHFGAFACPNFGEPDTSRSTESPLAA